MTFVGLWSGQRNDFHIEAVLFLVSIVAYKMYRNGIFIRGYCHFFLEHRCNIIPVIIERRNGALQLVCIGLDINGKFFDIPRLRNLI